MPDLNYRDLGDAFMQADSQFQDWLQEFEAKFFQPLQKTFTATLWQKLSEEQKVAFRQAEPKAAKELDKLVKGASHEST